MPPQVSSKTAIVTGSSRGIGKAVALRLAQDGFAVVINFVHNEEEATKVVAEIEKAGGKVISVQGDVAKLEDATTLYDQADETFGGIDVVVNNAGIIDINSLAEFEPRSFDRLMDVNVKGTFNMMHLGATRVREGGRIINFSTSALITSLPGYAIYNATKAAVEAMTRVLSKELGSRKITVNAVAPGPVATELFFQGKSEELVAHLKKLIPLGRLGEVDDIAPIVSFLAGPDSGWINGQVLRANGGMG